MAERYMNKEEFQEEYYKERILNDLAVIHSPRRIMMILGFVTQAAKNEAGETA